MVEKFHDKGPEQEYTAEQLEELGAEKRAEIERSLEQAVEQSSGETLDDARHEALELARTVEEEKPAEEESKETAPQQVSPTRDVRDASFKKTMQHIQKDMTPASRTFSKVIHNPVVDKTSEALGRTIARPNLILAGAIGTIILGSIVYFTAKHFGYVLSGFEAIATFIVGWAIGAVIEFARIGFQKKQSR